MSTPRPAVLVVEDNPITRKMMRFALEADGFRVTDVGDGRAALDAAAAHAPDLIVLDYGLPDTDGLRLLADIRRRLATADLPAVIVTGMVSRLDELQAGNVAARFVAKPIEPSRLLEVIREQLLLPAGGAATVRSAAAGSTGSDDGRTAGDAAPGDALLRQAAIQATALSILRGLSDLLAEPRGAPTILADVLSHCLDAAGLSTGLLYVVEPGGRHRLQAQVGLSAAARRDAEACFGDPDLVRRIAERREPVALSAKADCAVPVHRFLARLGRSSALVVPFVVLGKVFGQLILATDRYDLSEAAWIGFARSLALQFAQTMALADSLRRMAASEGRYRALMEQANDAILILEPGHRILEANLRAERLLGRPRDQLIGLHYDELVAAAEFGSSGQPRVEPRAGEARRLESRHVLKPDGTRVLVEVSVSVARMEDEALVFVILRDVTERERAQRALREAQQRLQHVVSSSPAVLHSARFDGDRPVTAWVSENVERVLGFTATDALAADWWHDHVHPDDRERVGEALRAIAGTGRVIHEYRFRHRDGHYLWLHDETRLLPAAAYGMETIGAWSDVSARKEAELKQEETAAQYRLLFDHNPYPIAVVEHGTFALLAVNDAAVRNYGYSRAELLELTLEQLRVPDDARNLERDYDRAAAEPGAASQRLITARHRKKDGTVIEVEVSRSPIVFEGRPAWLALVSDVTEKKSLQAQLLQAQKIESMGQLAAGVAHDFNNVLGVISGYAELLQTRLASDDRQAAYAGEVVTAAERATQLTRQLLAFSRKQVLQPRILDLNAVVRETGKMLRRLIGEDIEIATTLDDRLGLVRADPGQMDQVLVNLALNARDAMPRGGRLSIETRNVELDDAYTRQHLAAERGSYVMLAVSDDGCGMTAAVRSRLFEPFFTTKPPGKGTGLGLATVHGIVKQSGGQIAVDSEPGLGTTIRIYLPLLGVAEAACEPPAGPTSLPRGSETILLVEDEESLRELVRECLQSLGYTVLSARDPAQALEFCRDHPTAVHLLLTDVVMPVTSGRELAERLQALRPEMHVLYMSGYTDDAVVVRGVLARDFAFLPKPFSSRALAEKVREVLRPATEHGGCATGR